MGFWGFGNKSGIVRAGSFSWPMEDVVATVVVDISGRGFFGGIAFEGDDKTDKQEEEGYSYSYANHFFESLAKRMGLNLIIKLASINPDLHTNLEPIFKALGKALDQATQIDPRRKGVPSTKGVID